jgi:hypothetical protein
LREGNRVVVGPVNDEEWDAVGRPCQQFGHTALSGLLQPRWYTRQ